MQNIDVRFNATSNFGKVKADIAGLTAAANSLNTAFKANSYANAQQVVNPQAWRNATSAVTRASNVFRDAASSSGLLRTQQIRTTTEAEKYTKALQKQKLTMQEMWRNRGIMREVYRDQLRNQRMTAQYWGTDKMGRAVTDIAVPKSVPRDLDLMRNRMSMFSAMTASASRQVINLGKNIQWSGRQLMVGFTYPMALFGAAAGMMAFKAEDAFAKIKKVYDFSAEAQMDGAKREREAADLRAASFKLAEDAANKYGKSLSDTLAVEQQLAATGLRGKELFQATDETLRISTLGDIDKTEAADMIVALKNAFRGTIGTDAAKLTKTLNFMNAASNATSLSLQDIAQATPRAASGLAQLGVTAEEMTILLVSMRENGIEAAEGANALKSATTRILNPVSKASKFYKQFGIDIQAVSKQSGGNLYEFIQLLGQQQDKIVSLDAKTGEINKKETNRLKAAGVAALFGTYQYNRLFAALTNMNDALGGVNNQTIKAIELQNKSADATARMADNSLSDVMDNPAGRFKKAWQNLVLELQEMGQPFLAVAEKLVGVFSGAMKWFNNLGEGTKKAAMYFAIFLAAVGPAIMMLGLFFNLFGQFAAGIGKLVGVGSRLAGGMRLLTKEEQAAARTTEAANKALNSQAIAAGNAQAEINALTASIQKAIAAFNTMYGLPTKQLTPAHQGGAAPVAGGTQFLGGIGSSANPGGLPQQYLGTKNPIPINVQESQALKNVPNRENGRFISNEVRLMRARNKLAEQYMRSNNLVARDASKSAHASALQARMTEKMSGSMSGAAVAGGAMSASMVAMMVSSNETVDSIAKWGIILSVGVPLVNAMVGGMLKMAAAAAAAAASARAAAVANAAGTASLIRGAGAARVAGAGFMASMTRIGGMLGPSGLITLGITAVAGGLLFMKNRTDAIAAKQKEIYDKAVKANRALVNTAKDFATHMERAVGSYDTLRKPLDANGDNFGKRVANTSGSLAYDAWKYYQKDEKGKEARKEMAEVKDDADALYNRLTILFSELQQVGNFTAEESRQAMEGMLLALGKGGTEAKQLSTTVADAFGSVSKQGGYDWARVIESTTDRAVDNLNELKKKLGSSSWSEINSLPNVQGEVSPTTSYIDTMQGRLKQDLESYKQALKSMKPEFQTMGKMFYSALQNAASPEQAQAIMKNFSDAMLAEFANQMSYLQEDPTLNALFKQLGITTAAQFSDSVRSGEFMSAVGDSQKQTETSLSSQYSQYDTLQPGQKGYIDVESLQLRIKFAKQLETAMAEATGKGTDLTDKLSSWAGILKAMADENIWKSFSPEEAQNEMSKMMEDIAKKRAELKFLLEFDPDNTAGIDAARTALNNMINENLPKMRELNLAFGFAAAQNPLRNLYNMLNGVTSSAGKAKNQTKQLKRSLDGLPSRITVGISIEQFSGIARDAMSNVQSQMSDSAMAAFDASWDAKEAGAEAAGQGRTDALERAKEKALDGIKEQMDAQTKADELRQRLFENEKARLEKLAELQNQQIDFDQAVMEGRLDEAAKIQNNMQVTTAKDAMDKDEQAAQLASDKRMEQLEKREKAIERMYDRRIKAAEAASAREQAGIARTREMERASLEKRMELFKAYTAKNEKDLKAWMDKLGLKYSDFGVNLTAEGGKWAETFRQTLDTELKIAATQVNSDNMWERLGQNTSRKLLKSLGFKNEADFMSFVEGKPPKYYTGAPVRHGGGEVNASPGSRSAGGVPNTYKGLHRSERMILAQDGEYVVNRSAAKKYKDVLRSINKGVYGGRADMGTYGNVSSAFAPVYGTIAGVNAINMQKGIGANMKRGIDAMSKSQTGGGMFGGLFSAVGNGVANIAALGAGGRHRPINGYGYGSVHDSPPGVDFAAPKGTPVYAAADGRIAASYDIRGYEKRRMVYGKMGDSVQDGFRSYGRVIRFKTDAGPELIYAHLSQRAPAGSKHIPGGTQIGRVGNAGYVISHKGDGSHLHFASQQGSPTAWLRKGGEVKFDNTPALLHSGESVLTKNLTQRLKGNVASGGGDRYDVTLDLRGAYIKEDVDIEKAVYAAIDKKEARLGRKRVVS